MEASSAALRMLSRQRVHNVSPGVPKPMFSESEPALQRNRLLAALPEVEFALLADHLEPVALEMRQVLYEPGAPVETVYFPLSGLVSLVVFAEDGAHETAVEVAATGREGMVGVNALPDLDRTPFLTFCQVAGNALRVPLSLIEEREKELPTLTRLHWRYMNALSNQMAQTAACNLLHSVDKRCARWLLTARDRLGQDEFHLTHEFLAQMLGARRGTVTTAVRALADAGLIQYRWGQMRIVDRPALEAAGCSCYQRIRREHDQVLKLSVSG
jgi:CRP-like cAMP-binding protein